MKVWHMLCDPHLKCLSTHQLRITALYHSMFCKHTVNTMNVSLVNPFNTNKLVVDKVSYAPYLLIIWPHVM